MAGKKGQYIRPTEWAKHLRPRGKRQYWSAERLAAKKNIKKAEVVNTNRYPNPEE
jgi:hypothetical protein